MSSNMLSRRHFLRLSSGVILSTAVTGCTLGGRPPALSAARFDHADVLRVFVASGLDLDGRDEDNATALHVAAAHGKINAVRELLAAHAKHKVRRATRRTRRAESQSLSSPWIARAR
mgnify:CR=1 FL=1